MILISTYFSYDTFNEMNLYGYHVYANNTSKVDNNNYNVWNLCIALYNCNTPVPPYTVWSRWNETHFRVLSLEGKLQNNSSTPSSYAVCTSTRQKIVHGQRHFISIPTRVYAHNELDEYFYTIRT